MGDLEAAPIRSDPNPVKEQTMEETPSPEKVQESRTESGKCGWVFSGAGTASIIFLGKRE